VPTLAVFADTDRLDSRRVGSLPFDRDTSEV
jgi:hypothetical protein